MQMSDDCLPDCMMPDGGQCCAGYARQRQRIEALEAALRYYADPNNYSGYGMYELARAALAPEQDK